MMTLILYLATAVVLLGLSHRLVRPLSRWAALALILVPCCFVGRALVTGGAYAPVDLPYVSEPLRSMHSQNGLADIHNSTLGDLAWQIIPWKKAVRWAYAQHEWPLVNPFMLCGDILAGAAQPAAYSPFTLLSLLIPFAASLTYSAAIAFFVAGLTAFLLARELGCRESVALVAGVAWMFSTQLALFILWPIGFAWTFFPFVLLGTHRVVHEPGLRSGAMLCTALVLAILAGHPESVLHIVFASILFGLFELLFVRRRILRGCERIQSGPACERDGARCEARRRVDAGTSGRRRNEADGVVPPQDGPLWILSQPLSVAIATIGAGALALAICAVYLLPLMEVAPQTMEHAFRTQVFAKSILGATPPRIGARIANVFFPFTFQRKWKSQVNQDIPPETAAVGSLVVAMAAYAIWRIRSRRTWFSLALLVFCFGASVEWGPPLRLLQKLPLFDIAINERLSFVAAFAFCVLAALGLEELARRGGDRMAGVTFAVALTILGIGSYALEKSGWLTSWIPRWAPYRLSGELVPLGVATVILLIGSRQGYGLRVTGREGTSEIPPGSGPATRDPKLAAARWHESFSSGRLLVPLFLGLLLWQRTVEEGNLYPTIASDAVYPPIPILQRIPKQNQPFRVAGLGLAMIPDVAALYELEDPRGYEALTFEPLFDTHSLWSVPQPVFFNRIDDPTRPFLSFLNVRYLVAKDSDTLPGAWPVIARQRGSVLLENPRALERAFVPHFVRLSVLPAMALSEMSQERDFAERAWIDAPNQTGELPNGPGRVVTSRHGTRYDLIADMERGGWVVISQTAWKGWRAHVDGRRTALFRANRAFLAVNVPAGHHRILLSYRPDSFVIGRAITLASLGGIVLAMIWSIFGNFRKLNVPGHGK
jgi:hypothetical protein